MLIQDFFLYGVHVYVVGTGENRLGEAILTSTHNEEIKKIILFNRCYSFLSGSLILRGNEYFSSNMSNGEKVNLSHIGFKTL